MWQEDEEEDVRSYWMTLRTVEDTLIWKRRLWIALCGGIVLEEALDPSSDRLLNNNINFAAFQKNNVWTLIVIKHASTVFIIAFREPCLEYSCMGQYFCLLTRYCWRLQAFGNLRKLWYYTNIPLGLVSLLSSYPCGLISRLNFCVHFPFRPCLRHVPLIHSFDLISVIIFCERKSEEGKGTVSLCVSWMCVWKWRYRSIYSWPPSPTCRCHMIFGQRVSSIRCVRRCMNPRHDSNVMDKG